MPGDQIKQTLSDLRIYVGHSGFDQTRLQDTHRQAMAAAKSRLLITRPSDLLEAVVLMHSSGLRPRPPEMTYTQSVEQSERPR